MTEFMEPLSQKDPSIYTLLNEEKQRQNDNLELIASENFASRAVIEAMGSTLTNKYAEGLPGKRYYGGWKVVDKVEEQAQESAQKLFGAGWGNVQQHYGAQAHRTVT